MAALEDLKPGGSIRAVLPSGVVTVVNVQWFGSDAIELTYKDAAGKAGNELLYRMVAFGADGSHEVRYLRRPFHDKGVTTDFAGATVNFPFVQLFAEAARPS